MGLAACPASTRSAAGLATPRARQAPRVTLPEWQLSNESVTFVTPFALSPSNRRPISGPVKRELGSMSPPGKNRASMGTIACERPVGLRGSGTWVQCPAKAK